mgnify:CR=1 FL=1|tara:strand:+ start:623 stop:841 length:219 start_codon:yes stop_codon:yes gene_type:complete
MIEEELRGAIHKNVWVTSIVNSSDADIIFALYPDGRQIAMITTGLEIMGSADNVARRFIERYKKYEDSPSEE